jgi:hypothetical protein
MLLAPIISGRAFYEYAQVKWMGHKPSYPFGQFLSKAIHSTQIDFLSSYQNEMLSIGIVFLAITVLAYISMLIKTMFNLLKLALIFALVYLVYMSI